MPAIQPTPLHQWQILARRWLASNPGSDPLSIDVGVRRGDLKARAAHYIAVLDHLRIRPAALTDIACVVCGTPTASWCEGCYKRCGRDRPFNAVCNRCDQLALVCQDCDTWGISHEDGHLVYRSEHLASPDASETAISISAWLGAEGEFIEEETDVTFTFEDLARITGKTVEELRSELGTQGSSSASSS